MARVTGKDRAISGVFRRKREIQKQRKGNGLLDRFCDSKKKGRREGRIGPVLINRLVTTLGTSYVKKTWSRSDGRRCDGPAVAWRTVWALFHFSFSFSTTSSSRKPYLSPGSAPRTNYSASRINSTGGRTRTQSLAEKALKVFRVN